MEMKKMDYEVFERITSDARQNAEACVLLDAEE